MTDTSKLAAEANAISAKTAKATSVFAKDAAANLILNEAALADIEKRLAALEHATPIPPPKFQFGMCLYLAGDMQKAKDLTGATRARVDFFYAQPQDGMVTAAREAGLEPLPVVTYATSQQNGGRTDSDHYPPTSANLPQYAKDAAAIVQRYGFNELEVWNEAFSAAFWKPTPDWNAYLALVQAVAAEVWKVNAKCLILVSSEPDLSGVSDIPPPFTRWINGLLAADTGRFLTDPRIRPVVHPYCGAQSPLIGGDWPFSRYQWVYDAYKAHGHPDPQCWLTEAGWTVPEWATVQQQAQYHVDAVNLAKNSGMVEAYFGFHMHTGDLFGYNWLEPGNGYQPRPVCAAVKAAVAA